MEPASGDLMGWFERIGRRLESWVDDVVPDEIKSYLETGEEQLAAGRLEDAAHTLATAEEMRPDH